MNSALELLRKLIGPLAPHASSGSEGVAPRKAFAWARVATKEQGGNGLSIPEQLGQIRQFAEANGYEIVAEFHEAASAFRHQERRREFQRMLGLIGASGVTAIIVHDYSRFGRESHTAKALRRELENKGVRVISVTDPVVDPNTVAGVYIDAITYAKNEAYSREVAFHTRKGCAANAQARDPETGCCYKNGGQPLFGYKAAPLERGEVKPGRPRTKVIWVLDDTVVAARRVFEWARHCVIQLCR